MAIPVLDTPNKVGVQMELQLPNMHGHWAQNSITQRRTVVSVASQLRTFLNSVARPPFSAQGTELVRPW